MDIGDARIGIALSDALGITANPLEVYNCKGMDKDIQYIVELAKQNKVEKIVLGLPVNLDGTEGERAAYSRIYAEKLQELTDLPIDFEDESLTTVEAEEALIQQGLNWMERKKIVDKVAAAIILRCYLDRVGSK